MIVARGGHALVGYEPLLATSQGIGAFICLLSAGIMLRFILSEGTVTSERIFAALDVYLLIGIMCGLLFCIFEEQWPGSFSFQGSSFAGSKQNLLAHTIYFSFVTLGNTGLWRHHTDQRPRSRTGGNRSHKRSDVSGA